MRRICKRKPFTGERTRRRFLLLPKKIGEECRWLETAEWLESWIDGTYIHGVLVSYGEWVSIEWVN